MKDLIAAVQLFNHLADISMPLSPKEMTKEELELRQKLHLEEHAEFLIELDAQNQVGILHEGLDNIWITFATMLQAGVPAQLIRQGIAHMIDVNLSKVDGRLGPIKRREDGKILKPDGFKPVDMQSLFDDFFDKQIEGSHDVE